MKRFVLAAVCAVVLVLPQTAAAQTFLTVAGGVTTGGDAPTEKFTAAFNVTVMGTVFGLEGDIGYTPDFYNEHPGTAIVSSSNVVTFMGNLVVGVGHGPVRPYVIVGTGLLRSRVEGTLFNDVRASDWGLDAGAGVIGFFGDHFGLRGDARYFIGLQDPDPNPDNLSLTIGKFDFWRITGGAVIKF